MPVHAAASQVAQKEMPFPSSSASSPGTPRVRGRPPVARTTARA
ncbi:MAG: hypothetical protein ACJ79R_02955 [Anaeromyxobacteraceae bacterium]